MPPPVGPQQNTTPVRYNAYNDEFETNSSGSTTSLPKNEDNSVTFVINNKSYQFVEFTDSKGEKNSGYLISVSGTDKVKFYQREKVILEKEVFPNSSYDSYKAANYRKDKPTYFISLNSGIVAMPTRAKDFSKLFPGKEKQVLEIIKSNKISLDNTDHFGQLSTLLQSVL